jgi:hypothetical protein
MPQYTADSPPSPPYPNTRLLPHFLPLVVNTRHNKFSMKQNVNCSFCTLVVPKRMHGISVHRMCELTKGILKMIYYDNQTSVLDISKCLGVSYGTVFQKCSVLVFGWNREKRQLCFRSIKKKFNSVINPFKRLHLTHMGMKTGPVFERLREVLYSVFMYKRQNI